jgi:hypothetical protein
MPILANCFRRLQQVFGLRKVRIGIAVVHQRVQELRHLPNALLAARQAAIFGLLPDHKIKGLVRVILAVKLGDRGVGVRLVIPEFFLRLALAIARGDKIVPIVELFQRCVRACFIIWRL